MAYRSLKHASVWLAVATCVVSGRLALAQPSAYPADGLFKATTCGGQTSFDPVQDASWKDERDLAGDATYPAVYTYSDGAYMFVRWRLEGNPVVTTGGNKPLAQFGWGV